MWLPGYVIVSAAPRRFSREERIALGFGASAVLFGGSALLFYALGLPARPYNSIVMFGALVLALFFFVRGRLIRELQKTDKFALLVTGLVFAFAALYVALPGDVPLALDHDKVYGAKVPYLPADNYIPYRVSQFMVNGLDIDKTKFFLDWYFSDRTPLMGAVTASYEAALAQDVPAKHLDFADDTGWRLVDAHGYWLFRLVAALLSSIFLLPAYLLARRFFDDKVARLSLLFLSVNVYIIVNIVFTWPKLLMAYFLLTAFYFVAEQRYYLMSGGLLGLAYLSHPLAALFIPGAFAYVFLQTYFRGATFARWGALAGGALAVASPWLYWTVFVYRHASRMIAYPLGYVIRDPLNADEEMRRAVGLFLKRPVIDIVADRLKIVVDTFMPSLDAVKADIAALIDKARGTPWLITLMSMHPGTVQAYFHTIPGMLGASMWFVSVYGLMRRLKYHWRYIVSFLAVPGACVLAFWGLWPRGVGMDVLQPFVALLVPFGVYTLSLLVVQYITPAVLVIAVVEYAAIIWAGLGYFKYVYFVEHFSIVSVAVLVLLAIWHAGLAYLFVRTVREFLAAPAESRPAAALEAA